MSGRTERAAEWIYRGLWGVLVQWFRVPDEPPTLPVRPGDHLESFRPAPGWLRYMKFWFWVVLFSTDIVFTGLYIAAAIALCIAGLWWVAALLFIPAAVWIVAPDIIAWIALHLRYDTTWYVMTDRSMRIRRGIWIITETTITFENVQNVKITQGPVQRHFGIADVIVETAGGAGAQPGKGSAGGGGHQGVLAGISDPQRLRDLILVHMRASKSAGLGDEPHDHAATATPGWTPDHLAALREIRDEIVQLAG